MITFSELIDELISNINCNRGVLYGFSNKNSNLLYKKITELASFTGSRHHVALHLHFPDPKKINDIESYGTENISVVIDKSRRKFAVPKENIKGKAIDIWGDNVQIQDAYMYEGKEGLRIIRQDGRMEILPGSIHLWCKVDQNVKNFLDWLMQNIYSPNIAGFST
jgi:hydrogenase maturation factor HypF (carbamoyltransferase family)